MEMADKIVMRPVEALIPYARNARTHSDAQIAQIAGSMREFGFTNPVLLDRTRRTDAAHAGSCSAATSCSGELLSRHTPEQVQ